MTEDHGWYIHLLFLMLYHRYSLTIIPYLNAIILSGKENQDEN